MVGCSVVPENAYLGRYTQLVKLIHQQLGIKNEILPKKYLFNTNMNQIQWQKNSVYYSKRKKNTNVIDIAVVLTHNLRYWTKTNSTYKWNFNTSNGDLSWRSDHQKFYEDLGNTRLADISDNYIIKLWKNIMFFVTVLDFLQMWNFCLHDDC